jgi:hypothetical protein
MNKTQYYTKFTDYLHPKQYLLTTEKYEDKLPILSTTIPISFKDVTFRIYHSNGKEKMNGIFLQDGIEIIICDNEADQVQNYFCLLWNCLEKTITHKITSNLSSLVKKIEYLSSLKDTKIILVPFQLSNELNPLDKIIFQKFLSEFLTKQTIFPLIILLKKTNIDNNEWPNDFINHPFQIFNVPTDNVEYIAWRMLLHLFFVK